MRKLTILMLFLTMGITTAFADKTVKANDPNISFTGRVQRMDDGAVRYDWVGTYVQTIFYGSAITVRIAEEGESYNLVFIDGKPLGKIHFSGKEPHDVVLAKGLSNGNPCLRLQKVTEGGERKFQSRQTERTTD